MDSFPSMRWSRLFKILSRAPLNYRIERRGSGQRRKGSHRKLVADGRPDLRMAFHERQELPGGLVRTILVDQVGLAEEEARALL